MSEIERQERDRRSEVGAGDAGGARDGAGGVVATLAQMVRAGARSPADIAKFLQSHPAQRRELVSALHQFMGNGFVQNVLSLVGMSSAPAAPAAMHEPTATAIALALTPAAPLPELAHAPTASAPIGQVRVTSHGLHVRSSAARAPDNVIATLARHEIVTAVALNGAWMQITHGDKPAFVFAEFVAAGLEGRSACGSDDTAANRADDGSCRDSDARAGASRARRARACRGEATGGDACRGEATSGTCLCLDRTSASTGSGAACRSATRHAACRSAGSDAGMSKCSRRRRRMSQRRPRRMTSCSGADTSAPAPAPAVTPVSLNAETAAGSRWQPPCPAALSST